MLERLPRDLDPTIAFNDKSSDFSYMRRDDMHLGIMRALKRIEKQHKDFLKKGYSTNKTMECVDCGILHKKKTTKTITIDDTTHCLCEKCQRYYAFCGHCKKTKRSNGFSRVFLNRASSRLSPHELVAGKTHLDVCRVCDNDYYASCRRCGYRGPKEHYININNGRGPDGEERIIWACGVCADENRTRCHQCGKEAYTFVGETIAREVHFCLECSEMRRPIQEYYYKPSITHFHRGSKEGKVTNKALHFGFELEVERHYSHIGRRSMATLIKDRFTTKYVYVVHDGSIDEGIEIVSHPFTWSEYRENIGRWDDLLLFLRSKAWKANRPKVGFHVHMTKDAFTSFHLFKFLRFFYNKTNYELITKIAQRHPTSYSVFSEEDRKNVVANAKNKQNRDNTHYNAINLNNDYTVEVRMFRGTLEPLLFHKNIEFLHAAFHYTRDKEPSIVIDPAQFLFYAQEHAKKYPCLSEFLNWKLKGTIRIFKLETERN
jgi:hypothetical protein